MIANRITDEQIDDIVAGKAVEVDQEQMLHLLKFSIPSMPLLIAKTTPGRFTVVSINRTDPDWISNHPDEIPENIKARMDFAAAQLPPIDEIKIIEGEQP